MCTDIAERLNAETPISKPGPTRHSTNKLRGNKPKQITARLNSETLACPEWQMSPTRPGFKDPIPNREIQYAGITFRRNAINCTALNSAIASREGLGPCPSRV